MSPQLIECRVKQLITSIHIILVSKLWYLEKIILSNFCSTEYLVEYIWELAVAEHQFQWIVLEMLLLNNIAEFAHYTLDLIWIRLECSWYQAYLAILTKNLSKKL